MLALAPVPQISACPTIAKQAVVIKQNAPCAASWTDEKRFQPERHLSPLHGDDLRRLAAFLADAENTDVIARGYFEMLKRKSHWLPKCAHLSQRADIDFAAVIGGDRVQQFRAAHHMRGLIQKW